jgi:hypothetical protein
MKVNASRVGSTGAAAKSSQTGVRCRVRGWLERSCVRLVVVNFAAVVLTVAAKAKPNGAARKKQKGVEVWSV